MEVPKTRSSNGWRTALHSQTHSHTRRLNLRAEFSSQNLSIRSKDLPMATHRDLRTSLLIVFFVSAFASSEPTVYEILAKFNLPIGLLPDSVKSYTLSDDGSFEVILEKPCYVEFDYLVYYEEKITGKLSIGSITDLDGIQVKRFWFWFDVDEIRVDLPPSNSIYFQVGIINKELDLDQFETVHSCQDSALTFCRGSLRKILQPTVDDLPMLLTE